jgi:superfamily II RNA helicase
VKESQLELYPAQEEAILELYAEKNVILNTPTGSGKSLVATALHFHALALGKRSIYTCPIKALVNEKFLSLCRAFGPEQVGMITGDATVNPQALILCCTAEILAIDALRSGDRVPIADVIMDEFHYYSDRERGVAWQVPLLTLPQSRFLLMSATLGDTQFFESALTKLNGRSTVVVSSPSRPVPLHFEYSEIPIQETLTKLIEKDRAPVYLVNFTQRECAEEAQNLLSLDFCSKDEKKAISNAIQGNYFSSPYGKEIQRVIKHGIGIHHAGLLPKYRILVESLAQNGLLKIICGTDTLGVGVNIPIRTVLFSKLCKFDGEKTGILSIRDFQQIAGRAGRRGFDTEGYVIVQAPEHVIENIRLEQKAAGDPKKIRKIVKKKPPQKGYVPWNKETFFSLVNGQPETLLSRFKVSHSMLLQVLSREDGPKAMRHLIRHCHENSASKKQLIRTGFQLLRALIERKIIELNPIRLNIDLQEDFSLNHTLSLYLLDTLRLLDLFDPDYSLDLLTLVESILENPDIILKKQLDRVKTEKLNELKLQGVEYDERIAELEKLEYPKPNRDFIYDTFNQFSAKHPWVGQENIRPKSIAREMYEHLHTFSEYIREYNLQRAEGVLLRYLSEVYKVLVQTIPDALKTDEIHAMIYFFRSMIREVDSSLLDEWEKMRNPQAVSKDKPMEAATSERSVHSDNANNTNNRSLTDARTLKIFMIAARNDVFKVVKALASKDYETVLTFINPMHPETHDLWTVDTLETRMKEYYRSDHSRICIDAQARSPSNILIKPDDEKKWKVQQILNDPEQHNDWCVEFVLDLDSSQETLQPILSLVAIRSI